MSITAMVALFCILEIATPLVVEGEKTTLSGLNVKYNATILALITAIVLSVFISGFYMVINSIEMSFTNALYVFALIICNWLGATVGYDKVRQALTGISEV